MPAPAEPFYMTTRREADRLEGDGYAIAVYSVLCKHANKHGVCWPSVATICKAVGWSKTVVLPAIQRLVDGGFIVKEPRKLHGMDQSNRYRIPAFVQVSRSDTPVSRSVTLGVTQDDSGCHGAGHELNPIELQPKELRQPTRAHEANGANGHAPPMLLYRSAIGETTWAAVAAQFRRLDPSLTAAWFGQTMADAEVKYGEATRSQLEEAVKVTLNEVERRLKAEQGGGKMVGNVKGWSRAVFEANLRDALGVPT